MVPAPVYFCHDIYQGIPANLQEYLLCILDLQKQSSQNGLRRSVFQSNLLNQFCTSNYSMSSNDLFLLKYNHW